jgi:hypothetical protein
LGVVWDRGWGRGRGRRERAEDALMRT